MVYLCVVDGDGVVARLKAVSMLCISFSASAIVVPSERVELHFMLKSAILCFNNCTENKEVKGSNNRVCINLLIWH